MNVFLTYCLNKNNTFLRVFYFFFFLTNSVQYILLIAKVREHAHHFVFFSIKLRFCYKKIRSYFSMLYFFTINKKRVFIFFLNNFNCLICFIIQEKNLFAFELCTYTHISAPVICYLSVYKHFFFTFFLSCSFN